MGSWRWTTVGAECAIRPPKKEAKLELSGSDLVSFVPMETLGTRSRDFDPGSTRPLEDVYKSYTYFVDGDVLLAKITPCFQNGKLGIAAGLVNGVGFGSSEFFVLRCGDRLLPEFLFHFLSQESVIAAGVASMGGAVGHQRVPLHFVENLPLRLPPIPEQERIVAILDEAFAAIEMVSAKVEKNLANSVELFESILNDRCVPQYGWTSQELQEDVRFIDYRGRTPRKTKTGMRLITAKNVRMGFIQLEPQEFVGPETYESWMTRGIPRLGDVLFTTEAPLGLVAQLDTDEAVVFAQRVITLAPDRSRIDPTMLHYVLRSPDVQRRIHDDATGATARGIKASLLKKIKIALPHRLDDQRQIAQELAEAEGRCKSLGEIQRRKVEEYALLRSSILSQAMDSGLAYTGDGASRVLAEAGL